MSGTVEVAVVGGGIAGLAAGAALRRAGREVVVLEGGARPGGAAWSEQVDGHLVERGPNTFRVSAALAAFAVAHGLDAVLEPALPASRSRFLLRNGRLVPVPMDPVAFARSPLLTRGGKLRLLAEPFVRRGDPTGESVAEFAKRRFGCEVRDALIGPFLTGVYAGDETQLGIEAVFPALAAAERRGGSVVRGLVLKALRDRAPRGRAGTWSGREGVGALAGVLATSLGDALRCSTRVREIRSESGVHHLEIEHETDAAPIRAKRLLIATPAQEAAALLGKLDAEAADGLSGIAYAPVASVSLSIGTGASRIAPRGFGYLVPRGEGEALLGCLFSSQLFAGRAPQGRELLTLLAGGTRLPAALEWSDERLVEQLVGELDPVLGLREAPRVLAITRWPRAVPQPGRDHPRRVAALRERLAAFPDLRVAGAWADGVAFGDALVSGARAVEDWSGGQTR